MKAVFLAVVITAFIASPLSFIAGRDWAAPEAQQDGYQRGYEMGYISAIEFLGPIQDERKEANNEKIYPLENIPDGGEYVDEH